MESFSVVDKFYDISSNELKEFWDSEMDASVHLNSSMNDFSAEWNFLDKELPAMATVVLSDKLMTDAVLGGSRPIKSEHSYSLTSDGDSLPESPISSHRMDDMEDECYPAIPANKACGKVDDDEIDIKDEPISETDSQHSSCPSSPHHNFINDTSMDAYFTDADNKPAHQSVLKQNLMLTATNNIFSKTNFPKLSIKLEPGSTFTLPPTPPSCSSSEESEDNNGINVVNHPNVISISPSTAQQRALKSSRVIIGHTTSTRQPINTPLISSQPKGSTGTLVLTEEEKRTLIAEGYPVPTRLPLTKAEEKSLKKIRRKIKNKISAQESRRKKKEYMDQLERKVEILVTENTDYRKQIDTLESSNKSLMTQLAKLQAIVARTHPQLVKKSN